MQFHVSCLVCRFSLSSTNSRLTFGLSHGNMCNLKYLCFVKTYKHKSNKPTSEFSSETDCHFASSVRVILSHEHMHVQIQDLLAAVIYLLWGIFAHKKTLLHTTLMEINKGFFFWCHSILRKLFMHQKIQNYNTCVYLNNVQSKDLK